MQQFIEASNGGGDTQRFFWTDDAGYEKAFAAAWAYARSEGGYGYVVLMERNRLNDYVGPPVWGEPRVVREL